MFKNNIIDISHRFKAKKTKATKASVAQKTATAAPILDMTERREAIINEERREVRRTILTGFIGAFIVVPSQVDNNGGLLKVDIYDISEGGIAFDISEKFGHFKNAEELAMRVYLSQDTYFPFLVKIKNYRALQGEGSYRHGAYFIKGSYNDEALFHFIKFIETVSASLEKDSGDVLVSGLKK